MKLRKKKLRKCFQIRAYCSDCKGLLQESVALTRRELLINWDSAVVKAIGIPCEACGHKFPNLSIVLKIVDLRSEQEYDPKDFLPKPGYSVDDLIKPN